MNEIKISVPVFITKEGDSFVAYCPVLELSSYGDSIKDAKESFEDAIDIFLQETSRKGTLEKMLLSFGWVLRRLPNPLYEPPSINTVKSSLSRILSSETKSCYALTRAIPA